MVANPGGGHDGAGVIPPEKAHLYQDYMPIVFDGSDHEQAILIDGFVSSFGKRCAKIEDLVDPPRYRCLILCAGGAREVRR